MPFDFWELTYADIAILVESLRMRKDKSNPAIENLLRKLSLIVETGGN